MSSDPSHVATGRAGRRTALAAPRALLISHEECAAPGTVERAPQEAHEIGVVHLRPRGPGVQMQIPNGPWFAWYEDRVQLPRDPGIEVLADTEHAVQLFRAGTAPGLQFHPEVAASLVEQWLQIGSDHLPDGWTPRRLTDVWAATEQDAHRNCEVLVGWVLDELVGVAGPDHHDRH